MLRVDYQAPILHVTLNRPEVRNAFNDVLIAELTKTFETVPEGTRAVVLRGEGKSFCAGGDLEWMKKAANYSEQENYEDAMKLGKLFLAVARCPAVVISVVQGAAFGGGCGLVAASDICLSSAETKFAFSEVRLGLIPGTISVVVIPKIGHGHARALFVTGEAFDAEHAMRIGLIHGVAEGEALEAMLQEKLKSILSVGPKAVMKAKEAVLDFPFSMEEAAKRLASARSGEEGKEGVAAFLEKRKPNFATDLGGQN